MKNLCRLYCIVGQRFRILSLYLTGISIGVCLRLVLPGWESGMAR
ncbi:hypothetical protein [Coprobacter sp.]